MFLATTAVPGLWDDQHEILCLDSGCLRPDKQAEWGPLNYRVMSSPWVDRERFYEAARYMDEYSERFLVQLVEYLNSVHHQSNSLRYWRILVGPWLMSHLHTVYDRYNHLSDAFSQYPELQTSFLDSGCYQVPSDMAEYSAERRDDIYRLQVATELLTGMGYEFPTVVIDANERKSPTVPVTGIKNWIGSVKRARNSFFRIIEGIVIDGLTKVRTVALLQLDLPRSTTWGVAIRTGLQAIPSGIRSEGFFDRFEPVFDERRNGLAEIESTNEFERLFVRTLPSNFPTLYLEGFCSAKSETLDKFSKFPPMLMSDTGWYFNEPFKFLSAESVERGSRLVAGQHGGAYGVYKSAPFELHEFRISDSHAVWGWADPGEQKFMNLPSPKLSSHYAKWTKRQPRNADGPILFVTAPYRPYLQRFHSAPIGSLWEDYIDYQLRFFAASSEEFRELLLIRSRPIIDGWSVRERISDRFPDIRWDGQGPFNQSLKRCRLAVVDHPSTTFLESLAANVPTVLFWHPERYEWRSEAAPYFEALKTTGVLYHSPEEAAAKVASISDDPWEWWGREEVQQARRNFADRYAQIHDDWSGQWAAALKQQIKQTTVQYTGSS
jgi:putative transferase (TIGR04331 family)